MASGPGCWLPAPKGPIPERVRDELGARLERHARARWAERCRGVAVRFRGAYAYVDAYPLDGGWWSEAAPEAHAPTGSAPIRLCRLGFLGSVDRWAFAFYKYSDDRYEPSVVFSGSFEAAPEEAFDCAAFAYLSR